MLPTTIEQFSYLCDMHQAKILAAIHSLEALDDREFFTMVNSQDWLQMHQSFQATQRQIVAELHQYSKNLALLCLDISSFYAPAIYGPPSAFNEDLATLPTTSLL